MIQASAASPAQALAMVERRLAGEPIEVVVGWAGFCGLRIALRPGVFVPRRRTELLAGQAAALAAPGMVVVDLCCGSGAIAAAIAESLLPHRCDLWAADVDPVATECAGRNLERYGARVVTGDLFAALPETLRARVDLLVGNVPYVPTAAIAALPAEARKHEPREALDGGADGLHVLRRMVSAAPDWLRPGGTLLSEVAAEQVAAAVAVMRRGGLQVGIAHDPDRDATVVSGASVGLDLGDRPLP